MKNKKFQINLFIFCIILIWLVPGVQAYAWETTAIDEIPGLRTDTAWATAVVGGVPAVAYVRDDLDQLIYATYMPATKTWNKEVVLQGIDNHQDHVQHVSIADWSSGGMYTGPAIAIEIMKADGKRDIRFIYRNQGVWQNELAYANSRMPDIKIDPATNKPCITGIQYTDTNYGNYLWYKRWVAPNAWVGEGYGNYMVDHAGSGDYVGLDPSLAYDYNHPRIAYIATSPSMNIRYAWSDGTQWNPAIIPNWALRSITLTFDSAHHPHITSQINTEDGVTFMHQYHNGNEWAYEVPFTALDGLYPAVCMGTNDRMCVAYYDRRYNNIGYRTRNSDGTWNAGEAVEHSSGEGSPAMCMWNDLPVVIYPKQETTLSYKLYCAIPVVPHINFVSPDNILQGDLASNWVISGTGFMPGVPGTTVWFTRVDGIFDANNVVVNSPTEIRFDFTAPPLAGSWDAHVRNPYGQEAVKPNALTIIFNPALWGRIGVFRPSTHTFYLDLNGNGKWDGTVTDGAYNFGITGDIPVYGAWNLLGNTCIGVFRPSTHTFYLDLNGNGKWDGTVTDRAYNFGVTGDIPVSGNWDNQGGTWIGVFRPSTHTFYLDWNGNGRWDGGATDRAYNFGVSGDLPVSGEWDGTGKTSIGVFRPSTHTFYLDWNGNGVWDGGVTDRAYNFGATGDMPVSGDWDGSYSARIGVFRPSTHTFYLDYSGNGAWNGPVVDRTYNFGFTGDNPVSGTWS